METSLKPADQCLHTAKTYAGFTTILSDGNDGTPHRFICETRPSRKIRVRTNLRPRPTYQKSWRVQK